MRYLTIVALIACLMIPVAFADDAKGDVKAPETKCQKVEEGKKGEVEVKTCPKMKDGKCCGNKEACKKDTKCTHKTDESKCKVDEKKAGEAKKSCKEPCKKPCKKPCDAKKDVKEAEGKAKEAGEKVEEKAGDALEKAKETVEEAKDKVEEAGEKVKDKL